MGIVLLDSEAAEEAKLSDDEKKYIQGNTNALVVLILLQDLETYKAASSKNQHYQERARCFQEGILYFDEKNPPVIKAFDISDFWKFNFDRNWGYLKAISRGYILHEESSIISAIQLAEEHKNRVVEKFETYVVSYSLAGSVIRGEAKKRSDIDVYVVIDDTDAKKMTRQELQDKLRAIIVGMGKELVDQQKIKLELNVQTYLLTDYWQNLKSGNPIIFTLLRDAIPFYDRGLAIAWKQLLSMGYITPSNETISNYSTTAKEIIKKIEGKLKEIALEDLYYATLVPSQAALMLRGVPPPTPRETLEMMKVEYGTSDLFPPKKLAILERQIEVRKDIEKGKRENVTGNEIQEWLQDVRDYVETIDNLIKKERENRKTTIIDNDYEDTKALLTSIFDHLSIKIESDIDLYPQVKQHLVQRGFLTGTILPTLEFVLHKRGNSFKTDNFDISRAANAYRLLREELLGLEVKLYSEKRNNSMLMYELPDGKKLELLACDEDVFVVEKSDGAIPEYNEIVKISSQSLKVEKSNLGEFQSRLKTAKSHQQMITLTQSLIKAINTYFAQNENEYRER